MADHCLLFPFFFFIQHLRETIRNFLVIFHCNYVIYNLLGPSVYKTGQSFSISSNMFYILKQMKPHVVVQFLFWFIKLVQFFAKQLLSGRWQFIVVFPFFFPLKLGETISDFLAIFWSAQSRWYNTTLDKWPLQGSRHGYYKKYSALQSYFVQHSAWGMPTFELNSN